MTGKRNIGDMTKQTPTSNGVFQSDGEVKAEPRRTPLVTRKTTLALSTILGLGLLVPLAAPAVISPVQQARAAEAVIPDSFVAPTGFEDLVDAVMPAVVAVRVQVQQPVETSNRDIDRLPDGTPFDRFSAALAQRLKSSSAVVLVDRARGLAEAVARGRASSSLKMATSSPTTTLSKVRTPFRF